MGLKKNSRSSLHACGRTSLLWSAAAITWYPDLSTIYVKASDLHVRTRMGDQLGTPGVLQLFLFKISPYMLLLIMKSSQYDKCRPVYGHTNYYPMGFLHVGNFLHAAVSKAESI